MSERVDLKMNVQGVPELLKRLQAVKADVEQAVAASMLAAAWTVASDAKRRAPRLTGNLARSISPGVGQDPQGGSGPVEQTAGSLPEQTVDSLRDEIRRTGSGTAFVATNVVYAPLQEAINPYLRPAMDENRDEVQRSYRTALQQVLRRAERAG